MDNIYHCIVGIYLLADKWEKGRKILSRVITLGVKVLLEMGNINFKERQVNTQKNSKT